MEKSLISVTEQLAIIRLAKITLIKATKKGEYNGLCFHLEKAINEIIGEQDHRNYHYIKTFIPLFTKENANKHSNGIVTDDKDYFWWEIFPYDSTNRLKFLDWMEEDLLK